MMVEQRHRPTATITTAQPAWEGWSEWQPEEPSPQHRWRFDDEAQLTRHHDREPEHEVLASASTHAGAG